LHLDKDTKAGNNKQYAQYPSIPSLLSYFAADIEEEDDSFDNKIYVIGGGPQPGGSGSNLN
jgi:hypothetical protein